METNDCRDDLVAQKPEDAADRVNNARTAQRDAENARTAQRDADDADDTEAVAD